MYKTCSPSKKAYLFDACAFTLLSRMPSYAFDINEAVKSAESSPAIQVCVYRYSETGVLLC